MNELKLSNTSFTNKDFQTAYPELLQLAKDLSYNWDPTISNESDPGVVLIKELAITIDKINYNADKNALENFPLSVTQEKFARQIFTLGGYFPKWYRSAVSNIQLVWQGDIEKDVVVTLPLFTEIKDSEDNYRYTIIGQPIFDLEQNICQTTAIEGTCVHLEINNSTTITLDCLDSNNRIYINDYNIAQNGIYISNIIDGTPSLNFWKQVDNLAVAAAGESNYSFGIDPVRSLCYIEFPDDISTLIGDGLAIYYILSSGINGNVPINRLTQFSSDSVVGTRNQPDENNLVSINLNSENVSIFNTGLTFSGKNPESIDEAYNNYRKTIGTFDTLVTLRDYSNAIYGTEQVSNDFVCDRTNDIQLSYKICTSSNNISYYEYEIEPDSTNEQYVKTDVIPLVSDINRLYLETDQKPAINEFNLKIYALNYNDIITSKFDYDYTFQIYADRDPSVLGSGLYNLVQLLNDKKCISHEFSKIEENKMCLLKNKYIISCRILTTANYTDLQKSDIKNNIITSLYQQLNARKIEFGENIEYESLYDIILESDLRIKNLMLDNIEYETYAVYYDDGSTGADAGWKEICVSDELSYIKGYYNNNNFYDSNTLSCKDTIDATDLGTNLTVVWNSDHFVTEVINEGFTLPAIHTFTYNSTSELWTHEVDGEVAASDITTATLGTNYGIVITVGAGGSISNGASISLTTTYVGYLEGTTQTMYLDIPTNNIYYFDNTSVAQPFKLYSTYRNPFRVEIVAKNILQGVTPFLVEKDSAYTYRLNQYDNKTYDDTYSSISSKTTKRFEFLNGNISSTQTLEGNEILQFYKPSLVDEVNYGSYVKYEFYKTGSDPDFFIEANSSYILSGDEYIIFFFKESDNDVQYKAIKYIAGTIIKPSFNLYYSDTNNYAHDSRFVFGAGQTSAQIYLTANESTNLAKDNVIKYLTSANQVTVQKIGQISLDSTSAYYYFITNVVVNIDGKSKYVMNLIPVNRTTATGNRIFYQYMLDENEYFIYTNKNQTMLEIYGSGTKIEFADITGIDTFEPYITADIIDTRAIYQRGVYALRDSWKYLKESQQLIITEQEYVNVFEGGTVRLELQTGLHSDIAVIIDDTGFHVDETYNDFQSLNTTSTSSIIDISSINVTDFFNDVIFDSDLYGADQNESYSNQDITFTANGTDPTTCTWSFLNIEGTEINTYAGNPITTSVMQTSFSLLPLTFTGYTLDIVTLDSSTIPPVVTNTQLFNTKMVDYDASHTQYASFADAWEFTFDSGTTWNITQPDNTVVQTTSIYDDYGITVNDCEHFSITLSIDDEEIVVTFTHTPASDVTLSDFTSYYKQTMSDEEVKLVNNLTDALAWDCKTYLLLNITSASPQYLTADQTVTLTTTNDETEEISDAYLMSDETIITTGGSLNILQYDESGAQISPRFYSYNQSDTVDRFDFYAQSSDSDPSTYLLDTVTLENIFYDELTPLTIDENVLYRQSVTYNGSVTTWGSCFKYINDTWEQVDETVESISTNCSLAFSDTFTGSVFVFYRYIKQPITLENNSMVLPCSDKTTHYLFQNIVRDDNFLITLNNKYSEEFYSYTVTTSFDNSDVTYLHAFNDDELNNFSNKGIYYIDMPYSNPEGVGIGQEPAVSNIIIHGRRVASATSEISLVIGNLFKYIESTDLTVDTDELLEKLNVLDRNNKFNYTHQPDELKLIENPLVSKTFMNLYHFYNPYTICQIDDTIIKIENAGINR